MVDRNKEELSLPKLDEKTKSLNGKASRRLHKQIELLDKILDEVKEDDNKHSSSYRSNNTN